ncbi:testis-expressed protein 53 [Manis javanica]|uniref:testis-expressed protein 53 n=1 Tax=Manis javanica TaxID=9974 RepID=UPI003C6D6060
MGSNICCCCQAGEGPSTPVGSYSPRTSQQQEPWPFSRFQAWGVVGRDTWVISLDLSPPSRHLLGHPWVYRIFLGVWDGSSYPYLMSSFTFSDLNTDSHKNSLPKRHPHHSSNNWLLMKACTLGRP